ncbi:MAG: acetate--CoA ligase [Crocinitomicaceae bacterium]|nr:acetate--CoA ligase [Flavobacteriales bacterium]NQZ37820.1 acetate--CoA ligase [Crocinitomicaceae bacterium]
MSLRITSYEEYQDKYAQSVNSPEEFWSEIAETFTWKQPWTKTLDWNFSEPKIKWFEGGKLNITENLLDRHLATRGDQVAFYWEANDIDGEGKSITYRELHAEVCKLSNAMRGLGLAKGDRVCIYMPMILESVVAILACARIGAIHSIVFAGFSSNALADRINDAQAKLVITSDGLNRGNKQVDIKSMVDESLLSCPSIEHSIVVDCIHSNPEMKSDRDLWYHDIMEGQSTTCEAEIMDAEDMLFILYTSGSTGKPKGVVHTCGGYMVYTSYSFQNVFQYEEGDVFWCTADIGWITGHSYIVYGPLLAGATSVIFEGIPTYPNPGRFWQICEKYKVNQFYTAPTAIRSLMGCGLDVVNCYDLSSLKVIGSVGEPINQEAWHWYHDNIGKKNCPVVDTWWQTETGGIMLSGLGNLSPMHPTHAGYPLPGIQPVLLDAEGNEIIENNQEGYLCIKFPWPSILRTTYGDHDRCKNVYFSNYDNYYFTGDGAKRDENGMYRIIGRVDDVINVSGHRFGTAEIEDAINTNQYAIESAVVGYPHDIKGQGIYAYVVIDSNKIEDSATIISSLIESVSTGIGKIAKPDKIQLVTGLPKTRSGKIMRRILRKIAEGEKSNFGDTSTLLDPSLVEDIVEKSI